MAMSFYSAEDIRRMNILNRLIYYCKINEDAVCIKTDDINSKIIII
jgi:hypothetical protein